MFGCKKTLKRSTGKKQMTLVPKLYEGQILLFLLASLCVASQFLQLWSQTVNDPLRDKRWQKLHTNKYPENSLHSHICLGFGLFSQLSMRHALRKIVYARIGQGRTLINPSKWSNLLPTLLQLWHLNYVILLDFYTPFFFSLLGHFIDCILLKKIAPLHQLLHREWCRCCFYFCNIFSSRHPLFDTAEVEGTTPLLSLCFKGSFGWGGGCWE